MTPGGADGSIADAAAVAMQIGPAGGTVDGPGGVRIVIPPGALTTMESIGVEAAPSMVPGGYTLYSPVYQFTRAGITFAVPVKVTIPFPAGSQNPRLYWSKAMGAGYDDTNAVVEGNTMVASVSHFSWGFVGRLPVAAVPTKYKFTWTVNGHSPPTLEDCQKVFPNGVGLRDLEVKIVLGHQPFQKPYYDLVFPCTDGMGAHTVNVAGTYSVDVALVTRDLRYVGFRENTMIKAPADGVAVDYPLVMLTNP